MNGYCQGGPCDGQIMLSDAEFFNADVPPPPESEFARGYEKAPDIKVEVCQYEKVWHRTRTCDWYSWKPS